MQCLIGVQMVHSNFKSFLSPEGYLVRSQPATEWLQGTRCCPPSKPVPRLLP